MKETERRMKFHLKKRWRVLNHKKTDLNDT